MKAKLFILFLIITSSLFAQYNGKRLYFSVNYIYTTSSKLFLQPNSSDPVIRGTHDNLEDIWSYSGEIGYRLFEDITLGLSGEYLKKTFTNDNMNLGGISASMKDGFEVIPVELSIYYTLPFSTESFKFFMGGGGGLYFGNHIRQLGDVSVSTESRKIGYGIQVAVGMDYLFYKNFAVRGQMRFRDPEFEMKNSYSSKTIHYEGRTFILSSQTFSSKVNVDGISFAVGILFQF